MKSRYIMDSLGNYVKIRTGKLDANANDPNGIYPFFTCALEPLRINSYSFDCECILVAGNGDLNVKYYDGKFEAYQRTYVIESRDKFKLDVRYLFHFMSGYVEKLREMSIGGVIKYIKLNYLNDAEIPLPSLNEQRRIAAILDKADAIRRKRQESIHLTEEFIRSTFMDMFGDPVMNSKKWGLVKFDDIGESTKLGLVRSAEEMDESKPYPYVRMDAIIGNGDVNLENLKHIDASEREISEYSLVKEDFLFNTRNSKELVGKTCLFNSDGVYLFNNNIMRIRFNKQANPFYMITLFQTDEIKHQLESVKSGTTSVFAIYYKNLKNLSIMLPPIELQKEFSSILTTAKTHLKEKKLFIGTSDLFFNSISRRAFRGELS